VSGSRRAAGQWILVTDGRDANSRRSVETVRALAVAGYRPAVTVASDSPLAGASRHCLRIIRVPSVAEPGYAEAVMAEAARHRYLAVLPASDAVLLALKAPVRHLLDKSCLAQAAHTAGLKPPPGQRFPSFRVLADASPEMNYPVVVKPLVSVRPPVLIDGPRALTARAAELPGPVLVQPFLEGRVRGVSGVSWRGRVVGGVHYEYLRRWPTNLGAGCAAKTMERDRELESRLARLLGGYEGVFQVQLIGSYLLDVNPRVHGLLALSLAAGVNLPALYCDLLRGEPLDTVEGRPGVYYRWLEGDIRHLIAAVRGGRMGVASAASALFPRRGTAHSIEFWRDPLPMLARTWSAIRRVL
jgi:hypothetical protein